MIGFGRIVNVIGDSFFWLSFFLLFYTLVGVKAQAYTYPLVYDDEGRMLVDVHVLGQGPYKFLLDSGASHTVVYTNLPIELDINAIPLRSKMVRTSTGRRPMQLYDVGAIDVLGVSLQLGATPAIPLSRDARVFGIIGSDLLKGRIIQINPAKKSIQVLMDPPDDLRAYKKIQGRYVGYGSMAVVLQIDGVTIPALLDTGATKSVLNTPARDVLQKAGAALFPEKGAPTIQSSTGSARGSYLGVNTIDFVSDPQYDQSQPIALARTPQVLISANLPVFKHMGARNAPAMLLGMDYLSGRNIILDMQRMALYWNAEKSP